MSHPRMDGCADARCMVILGSPIKEPRPRDQMLLSSPDLGFAPFLAPPARSLAFPTPGSSFLTSAFKLQLCLSDPSHPLGHPPPLQTAAGPSRPDCDLKFPHTCPPVHSHFCSAFQRTSVSGHPGSTLYEIKPSLCQHPLARMVRSHHQVIRDSCSVEGCPFRIRDSCSVEA